MSNRYKKIERKLKPLPFIIIGVIALAIAVFVVLMKDSPQERFYKEFRAFGVTQLAEDHVFKEINYKTLMKKVKAEEDMLVFFGDPSCTECQQEVHAYDIEFKELNLKEKYDYIYYVNASKLKEREEKKIEKDLFLSLEVTPMFVYFEKGEIVLNRASSQYMTEHSRIQGQVYKFLLEVKRKK